MEKNVCGVDRLARAVLGAFLLTLLIRSRRRTADDRSVSVPEIVTAYAIAELSINVFTQWCPLNALLGFDSCRRS